MYPPQVYVFLNAREGSARCLVNLVSVDVILVGMETDVLKVKPRLEHLTLLANDSLVCLTVHTDHNGLLLQILADHEIVKKNKLLSLIENASLTTAMLC